MKMLAIEAMRRNRPLTPERVREIQRNIMEIAKPFNSYISDIYARSPFTLIVEAGAKFSETIYPKATRDVVREIIELRDSEIKRFLEQEGIADAAERAGKGDGKP